eukprot:comp22239_c0_seq1/m.52726 comp22239_c0_seq1/g.52726  ORF comp22239_c0_seq1/g.52726 comp22239_c0_seq1/m.52726 type:complete len:308 (-) comp22239_c0_seq1:1784-2707(-)
MMLHAVAREERIHGLRDIGAVDVVVIRQIAVGHVELAAKVEEGERINVERGLQVEPVKERGPKEGNRPALCGLVELENVKRPVGDLLQHELDLGRDELGGLHGGAARWRLAMEQDCGVSSSNSGSCGLGDSFAENEVVFAMHGPEHVVGLCIFGFDGLADLEEKLRLRLRRDAAVLVVEQCLEMVPLPNVAGCEQHKIAVLGIGDQVNQRRKRRRLLGSVGRHWRAMRAPPVAVLVVVAILVVGRFVVVVPVAVVVSGIAVEGDGGCGDTRLVLRRTLLLDLAGLAAVGHAVVVGCVLVCGHSALVS